MSIPSWAVKGAKVVCIKQGVWKALLGDGNRIGPENDEVCVVTGHSSDGDAYISLAGYSLLYCITGFRPLVSKKTEAEDVAMIKDLIGIKTEERV